MFSSLYEVYSVRVAHTHINPPPPSIPRRYVPWMLLRVSSPFLALLPVCSPFLASRFDMLPVVRRTLTRRFRTSSKRWLPSSIVKRLSKSVNRARAHACPAISQRRQIGVSDNMHTEGEQKYCISHILKNIKVRPPYGHCPPSRSICLSLLQLFCIIVTLPL